MLGSAIDVAGLGFRKSRSRPDFRRQARRDKARVQGGEQSGQSKAGSEGRRDGLITLKGEAELQGDLG